ncbi:MAG: 50S ribosomal protein L25/general stress protein Ctc, partial [Anaerovorax sp.]
MDVITAEKRNAAIKAKHLRHSGIVPCVIYGGALTESLSIQIDEITVNKIFKLQREGSKIKIKLDDQIILV